MRGLTTPIEAPPFPVGPLVVASLLAAMVGGCGDDQRPADPPHPAPLDLQARSVVERAGPIARRHLSVRGLVGADRPSPPAEVRATGPHSYRVTTSDSAPAACRWAAARVVAALTERFREGRWEAWISCGGRRIGLTAVLPTGSVTVRSFDPAGAPEGVARWPVTDSGPPRPPG